VRPRSSDPTHVERATKKPSEPRKPSEPATSDGKPSASVPPGHWSVEDADANQTILTVIRRQHPDVSWGAVRKLLEHRHVTVNGNLCVDEGRRLKVGEVVKILPYSMAAPPREADVRIRYVDAHLVVVEKPAGMTTLRHPEERHWPKRRRQLQPTLDEILPRILARQSRKGPRKPPPGAARPLRPVHRLDRETSGLMVFARTVDAERGLGRQFKEHTIHRVYLAIASGHVSARTVKNRLVDDRGDGRRGSTRNPRQGKVAVTHIKPQERFRDATLVECTLETGRTHQIRIHLSESGHPVLGDKVYRGPFPGKPLEDRSGAPRLCLHAAELGFEHPVTGKEIRFAMPLPGDMGDFLTRLRSRSD
jgi:23S rRNA pseudouridine1911/1915/1917 synthase